MRTHIGTIRNRELTIDDLSLVAGTVGEDALTLDCDEEWGGLSVTVAFIGDNHTVAPAYVDGAWPVPWECIQHPGKVYVVVEGRDSDGRVLAHATMARPMTCRSSGTPIVASSPTDPTVTELTQARLDAENATAKALESAITAVTVSTLDAGADATAALVAGTDGQTLALGIPRGAQGVSVYRGSDISAMEANGTLYTNIANGTFKDVFVGDYFRKSINGTDYVLRIAALDYYYGFGDTAFNTHHAVIVPDATFGTAQMNSSDVVTGGYVGTKMRTETLQTWLSYLKTAFGSHLLTPRCLYDNKCDDSSYNGAAFYDGPLELMTEEQVYGARQQGITNHSGWCYPGVDYAQFPLFALDHSRICNRSGWWLRSVISSKNFAFVGGTGNAYSDGASTSHGVRPRFLIG